jgi:hypothetical protein
MFEPKFVMENIKKKGIKYGKIEHVKYVYAITFNEEH